MRLDKYLKVSRIIKRRTIAKEACEQGKICVNGRVAKPGHEIKIGDVIEITLGERKIKAEILDVSANSRKEDARDMYKILEGEEDKE